MVKFCHRDNRYYFRSSDRAAICGKNASIGGIVYSFNQNGICKGKFTGYALDKDGVVVK